jgi:uncharacterized protein YndB with AHSA1/START domain
MGAEKAVARAAHETKRRERRTPRPRLYLPPWVRCAAEAGRPQMSFHYDFRMQIGAPRPTVFERLLRIEHLSRWFCGWSRIEPKVGGSFKFGGETCILPPEGRAWETTIDEGEVLRRFAFRWPIRSVETRVSYDLEDGPGGTALLHVTHQMVPIHETTCGSVQDAWRMCLGNLKSIAEGRGDSVRPDHSPVSSPEVRLSALVEATPSKVFDAFAVPSHVAHWTTGGVPGQEARVDPRPGGVFSFESTEELYAVVEWVPSRRIALRRSLQPEDRLIRFDFEEKASGTAVYLTATGFRGDDTNGIRRQRGRWSDRLVCLKNFVESGASGFANPYEDQVRET